MYLFILSIVISVIVAIVVCCTSLYGKRTQNFFFGFSITFILTNFVFFIWSLFLIESTGIEQEPLTKNTTSIVAFEASTETQGVFIFGSGNIGAEQSFYYIEETSKGKQIKTILNDDTVFIKEDNNVSPNISTLQSYTVRPEKYKKWCYIHGFYGNQYTVITIPENSIKYEYNLDLQKLK